MEEMTRSTLSKHLAGIIPVSGFKGDIDSITTPGAMLIANGFYNIQRAIVECCYAGCGTIWISCDEKQATIFKKICGDFVTNMHDYERSSFTKFPSDNRRVIPIFYVPLSYKNQHKYGTGVSLIDTMQTSFTISSKLSKWIVPNRYYVASPYGVYNPEVNNHRKEIMSDGVFMLSHKGRTAIDGEHLGFSFGVKEAKHCNYLFKRMGSIDDIMLDKVIDNDIFVENKTVHEIDKYHNIWDWEGYQYMWSDPIDVYPKYRFCFSNAFNKQERKLN